VESEPGTLIDKLRLWRDQIYAVGLEANGCIGTLWLPVYRFDKRVRGLLKAKPFLSVTIERSFVALLASIPPGFVIPEAMECSMQWNVIYCNTRR
jgi:hypothetical protein